MNGILFAEPSLYRTNGGIGQKVGTESRRIAAAYLHDKFSDAVIPEMRHKGVLSLHPECLAVKIAVLPEISAKLGQTVLRSVVARSEKKSRFGVEDPVHKGILILEVIVKALAVHITACTYLGYADLQEGLFSHQLLEGCGESSFGNSRISQRHHRPSRSNRQRVRGTLFFRSFFFPPFIRQINKKQTYLPLQISLVITDEARKKFLDVDIIAQSADYSLICTVIIA